MHLGCETFTNTLKMLSQKFEGWFSKVIKQVYHTPTTRNLLGIHRSLPAYPIVPALGAAPRQRSSLSKGRVPAKKLQPGADRWWPIRKLSQRLSHHGTARAPHNSSLTIIDFILVSACSYVYLHLPGAPSSRHADSKLSWVNHSSGVRLTRTHHSLSES